MSGESVFSVLRISNNHSFIVAIVSECKKSNITNVKEPEVRVDAKSNGAFPMVFKSDPGLGLALVAAAVLIGSL